jgi:hypothetical protein
VKLPLYSKIRSTLNLQLSLGVLSRYTAVNQTVGVALRCVNLGVLAVVLQALEPAEVNLKVVLVGQSVLDIRCVRGSNKDLVAHVVHGGLHTRAVLLCKCVDGNLSGSLVALVELVLLFADLFDILELLPLPRVLNLSAENAVPGFGKSGVLVSVEAVEGRAGALENQEAVNAGLNGDALTASCDDLDGALVGTVAEEGVRVVLAVDGHATPAVDDNLDMCDVNVAVSVDEVLAKNGSEELRRVDGVLFGKHIDGLLLGIGRDDGRVVCLCVAAAR